MENPYCSLVDLKAELKLPTSDTSKDAELEAAIVRASRWIDDYRGRTFYARDFTETPWTVQPRSRHIGFDSLFPPFGCIRSVTSIIEGGAELDSDSYVVVDGSIDRIGGRWVNDDPAAPLQVFGLFGYPQPSVDDADVIDPALVPVGLPEKIGTATMLVAAALSGHSRKDVVGFDGSKQSVQDRTIPDEVFALLGPRSMFL